MAENFLNFNDLLTSADDAGFSTIPASDYEAEVAKAEANTTKSGKHQIVVRFKIIAGPQAGKSVFNNFVISPENANALGFFFRHMAALGLERDYWATNPPLSAAAALLVGRKATITVSIEQWNGQDRNRVNGIKKSVGGGGATPFVPGMVTPTPMAATPPLPQPPAVSAPMTVPAPPAVSTPTDAVPTSAPDVPF